jgi:hypothetical protein
VQRVPKRAVVVRITSLIATTLIFLGAFALSWRDTAGLPFHIGDKLWQMGVPVDLTILLAAAIAIAVCGYFAGTRLWAALCLFLAGITVVLCSETIRGTRSAVVYIGDTNRYHPGYVLACAGGAVAIVCAVIMTVALWSEMRSSAAQTNS